MEDLSGRSIRGYELRERVGEGGFGAVYRAQQRLIGREVAVKIILPQFANQADFIRRFETEAQLVARLEHPHIVPLYDYWREPSGAYLVMRYLRGGSLHQHLTEHGAMNPQRVSEILTQIAAALTVAHRQGVIHRDLKPENILLDENGNAYLTDFGIAKDLAQPESLTKPNAIIGSPAYISPEQIKGEPLTPQSDIYMLGMLLFEMLTGAHPYPEATSASLLFKHLSEPMPELFKINPDLPLPLNKVLQRATHKEIEGRYSDVLDLASEFRRALRVDQVYDEAAERAITSGTLTLPDPENPYKGLRAFQQADTADFFGRESLTETLLGRLTESHPHARFLAVVGPSGSGKSSVVKAGVIPALQKGKIDGSDKWFIVEMVPGIDPMEELEATLLRIAVNPPDSLLNQLNEDERGFVRAVKRVLPDDNSELVLFIDQFEELFTLVDEEPMRTRFMDSLSAAVMDARSRIRVIITLRADFYDRPLSYARFGELMQQRTEVVLPLTTDEIERAISRPADRAGLQLERGLVTAIVTDVKEQPGALPLLQYALTELYERRQGRSLLLSAYHAIGGTMGALAQRADELYAGLGKEGQEAARQMFLRLVTLGEGAEDTRRRVFQAELLAIAKDEADTETISSVLDAFGRYRLLTFDNDPMTRQSTVEVAHEALIRQWGRLKEWLNASREQLRTQRWVTAAAEDWSNAKQDPSFLASGNRLDQLETWYQNSDLALTQAERDYMDAAIALRAERRAQEQERQRREDELERRSRDRLRLLVGVSSVAAVLSILLSVFAFSQSVAANAAQQEAEQARLAAEDSAAEANALALAANARSAQNEADTMLALGLAVAADAAYQPSPVEVTRMLASAAYAPGVRQRLTGHTTAVLGVSYHPNGQSVASGSAEGLLHQWDLATGATQWAVQVDGIITSVAYSPDGQYLASAGTDQLVRLWDSETGALIRTFEGHEDKVTAVKFSPDGSTLLSGAFDRTLRLWDVETGEQVQQFDHTSDAENPLGAVMTVSFSRDGARVLASTVDETILDVADDFRDRTVRVWDVATGEQLQRLDPMSGFIRAAAFNADGTQVTLGVWDSSNDGTLRTYDISTGAEIRRIYAHSDIITQVTYSQDGQALFSASWDGTLRQWDAETGVELARFAGFNERLLGFDLSADGEYVVMGVGNIGNNDIDIKYENSRDTSVWLIDLKNRIERETLRGHYSWVWEVDISPDNQYLASGAGLFRPPTDGSPVDNSVRIWDLQTGELIRVLEGHTGTVDAVAYSPDGMTLLTGGWDKQLIWWNASTGEILHQEADAHPASVTFVAISPDGQYAVSGDMVGTLILWDFAKGAQIRHLTPNFADTLTDTEKEIGSISFNVDGSQVLISVRDGSVRMLDINTGEEVLHIAAHPSQVNRSVLSHDGRIIASASRDSTVRLWDAETGALLSTFEGHTGAVMTVAFSPDDRLLFTGGADQVIRMWDIASGQELRRFAGHSNWISTIRLTHDGNIMVSGAQDDTLKLWNIARSTEELTQWANDNRYLRPFTCKEQSQYRLTLAETCQ